ncbi:hypothetical protein MIR68_003593 [Amoeboaphelidium protococcarum]|nr:hypothetical protein MIR68_003593 [Amoeboaphelidium protococcarum]
MSKSRINQLDLPSVGVVYDISQYQLPAINEEQLDQDEGAVNGDNDENQFQDACENKIEAYVVNIQRSFNPAEESGSDYETADEDQSAKLIGPEDNNVGFNFQSVSREGAPDGHEIPLLTVPYFQHLSEFDSEENAPYINSLKSRKV